MSAEQPAPINSTNEIPLLEPLSSARLKFLRLATVVSFVISAGSVPLLVKSHFDLNDAHRKFNESHEFPDQELLREASEIITERAYKINEALREKNFDDIYLLTSPTDQELYEAAQIVKDQDAYTSEYGADTDIQAARNLFGLSVMVGIFSGLYGVTSALGLKVRSDLEKLQKEILEKKSQVSK